MSAPLRLLFVDDEERVLRGMQRSLAAFGDRWDLHFTSDPTLALEQVTDGSFDAVISDMDMPAMTGADLLGLVQRRAPGTMRLIHCDSSDVSAILQAVGPAHQFLEKPATPEQIAHAVESARALRDRLESEHLRELVGGAQSLPSLPSLYARVVRAIEEERAIAEIAEIIEADPAMTAKILQLANSGLFAHAGGCDGVARATMLLGTETIQALVIGAKVFEAFKGDAEEMQRLWTRTCRTAGYARAIARLEKIGSAEMAQTELAAMLHEAGLLLLMHHAADLHAELGTDADPDRERARMGATHGEIGARLLELWGFSHAVTEAVAFHHEPSSAPKVTDRVLAIVHVAQAAARCPADGIDLESLGGHGADVDYLEDCVGSASVEAWVEGIAELDEN